ncbi:MAG: LPP20 family lipoprotein [Gallionellaceae bacterium]|nr:LPP20 family lipoprotein [Gallionellaceae bacterium]
MKFPIAVFFVALMLGACASDPPQPDWIAGNSKSYSSAQYLIGHGMAATQEEAKDRARADLSKIFQVAVVAESEDSQKFKNEPAGVTTGQYETASSRHISTRTEQIIRGIQIAELWQDPLTHTYYALAILPRLQTAASLRQQISQLDEATKNYIEQSRLSSDLFLQIATATRALESQQERAGLQQSLQIVDATGQGVVSPWNSAVLKADRDELIKRVRLVPQVSADAPPGLAEAVAGALAQAGFMITPGQNAEYLLQARMNLTDLGLKEGWYWQRGDLEITLSEAASGRIRGTQHWPIKSNAPDRETAIKRAMDQAGIILNQNLGAAIVNMANSR